jgi:hypothetical protein
MERLGIALRSLIKKAFKCKVMTTVGRNFLDLTGKRDKYGRDENHPDFGRESVIEDTKDDDDFYDDGRGKMRGYSL